MTRLVVHAGFHKTGTSSVQATLHHNRERLAPHLRLFLKQDFERLTTATRAYSAQPGEAELAEVGRQAARFFRRLKRDDPRPVLMCSEDLAGHLPGRRGLERYAGTARIMATLAENAGYRFGASLDMTIYFSTRAPEDWLRSAWWQNLRSTRLTEGLEEYADAHARAADLNAILQEVAAATAPVPVVSTPLEQSRERPEGPLAPLLDLLGLDAELRASLESLPPVNVTPEIGLDEVFLALNRSALKEKYLRETKVILRRFANRQAGGS